MRSRSLFIFSCLWIWIMAAKPFVAAAETLPPEMGQLMELVRELQSSVADLKQTVESQNEVIRQQTVRINALEDGTPVPAAPAASAKGTKLQGLTQGFNPDIGVVGTVQAHLTESEEDGEGRDTIALKELEVSFAQYVDPYSRLDAIIAFNDNLEEQNVDIEEAYYSHWGLPWGFQGQIGKFRSKIGKQNLLHLHQLDTVDYPLVIQDFFGEEGLSSSGIRLQNMVPNPWDVPLEISGEVLRGNNGNSFSGVSRRPIFNVHAKTFFETSENTSLELGWTTLFGDENPPQFSMIDDNGEVVTVQVEDGRDKYGVRVFGADATFLWHLPEERKLKFQNEIYWQRRGNLVHINDDPWGLYTLLDYRFSKRFSAGIRFDYLEPLDVADEHGRTTAISPYFTFWQSEFAQFRIQYSHTDPASADARSDDAIYLQANFLIGAHQHPVQ